MNATRTAGKPRTPVRKRRTRAKAFDQPKRKPMPLTKREARAWMLGWEAGMKAANSALKTRFISHQIGLTQAVPPETLEKAEEP